MVEYVSCIANFAIGTVFLTVHQWQLLYRNIFNFARPMPCKYRFFVTGPTSPGQRRYKGLPRSCFEHCGRITQNVFQPFLNQLWILLRYQMFQGLICFFDELNISRRAVFAVAVVDSLFWTGELLGHSASEVLYLSGQPLLAELPPMKTGEYCHTSLAW